MESGRQWQLQTGIPPAGLRIPGPHGIRLEHQEIGAAASSSTRHDYYCSNSSHRHICTLAPSESCLQLRTGLSHYPSLININLSSCFGYDVITKNFLKLIMSRLPPVEGHFHGAYACHFLLSLWTVLKLSGDLVKIQWAYSAFYNIINQIKHITFYVSLWHNIYMLCLHQCI